MTEKDSIRRGKMRLKTKNLEQAMEREMVLCVYPSISELYAKTGGLAVNGYTDREKSLQPDHTLG